MRRALLLFMLAMPFGCEHRVPGPPPVVNLHEPYRALPPYLIAENQRARDFSVERQPVAGEDVPMTREQRLQRVRAVLAVIDTQVAALTDQPSQDQQAAMVTATQQLRELLKAWPDILTEGDELVQQAQQLGHTLPPRQAGVRRRINELSDLIRLQLFASQ